jgi:hypothetical protein
MLSLLEERGYIHQISGFVTLSGFFKVNKGGAPLLKGWTGSATILTTYSRNDESVHMLASIPLPRHST